MNKTFVVFVAGFACGVIVAEKYFSRTYKRIADEEIEAVRRRYSGYIEAEEGEVVLDKREQRNEYAEKISREGYSEDVYEKIERPYVISPEEFGEYEDYQRITLTYYEQDDVICDEYDEPLDDADDIVGLDSVNHYGEYEDDTVFVRNDRRKTDYEILLDHGSKPIFYT